MSYVLSLQNVYPFRDIFTIIEKQLIFYSKLNSGDTNSCYRRKWYVSTCRSGKKVIAKTNNYSESDSGKGSYHGLICVFLELDEPDARHILHVYVAVGTLGVGISVEEGGYGRRGDAHRVLAVHLVGHHILRLQQRLPREKK